MKITLEKIKSDFPKAWAEMEEQEQGHIDRILKSWEDNTDQEWFNVWENLQQRELEISSGIM